MRQNRPLASWGRHSVPATRSLLGWGVVMTETTNKGGRDKLPRLLSKLRILAAVAAALATTFAVTTVFDRFVSHYRHLLLGFLPPELSVAIIGLLIAISLTVAGILAEAQRSESVERIEKVEDEFRRNPEKPQLAWDLARSKLENYLDRNLAQAMWIFWLTIFVMAAGFTVVVIGLVKALDQPSALAVSIVSSASGIIISFLGASFLLIYRSVAEQTRSYVSVLERINAVGMAVQVLATVTDDEKELKNRATAALAKQLLDLYSAKPTAPPQEIQPV